MDIERAKQDPSSEFSSPEEILQHSDIDTADKITILKQWDYDTREQMVGEEESLGGSDNASTANLGELLRDIRKALQCLDPSLSDDESDNGSPTKQG